MVQKKFIKIGVVAISMVALAIGLGVGISQSQNKNSTAASASNVYSAYDCDGLMAMSGVAKAGKGPTSPSEGKAGKGPTSPSEGKSGKGPSSPSEGKSSRRKLRNEMLRGLQGSPTKSGKGPTSPSEGKAGKGPSSPSEGKSGKPSLTAANGCASAILEDICTGKSGKSGPTSPSEGKSGKSGPTSPSEGKSGKSGPTSPSEGKAGKASGPTSPTVCTSAGKSGKSGPTAPSCGKSGKSNGSGNDCTSAPTVGVTTASLETPPPVPADIPFIQVTPAPTPVASAGSSETVAKGTESDPVPFQDDRDEE